MKKTSSMKTAMAALGVIGSLAFAAPSQAATLSPAAKQIMAGIAASPTPEEKAVVKLLEQVQPGSTQTFINMARNAPDLGTLATNVEAYTALNPSLQAVLENMLATFVADPRLAPVVAATNCTADVANIHSLVRIWCGLPALDPYPVVE